MASSSTIRSLNTNPHEVCVCSRRETQRLSQIFERNNFKELKLAPPGLDFLYFYHVSALFFSEICEMFVLNLCLNTTVQVCCDSPAPGWFDDVLLRILRTFSDESLLRSERRVVIIAVFLWGDFSWEVTKNLFLVLTLSQALPRFQCFPIITLFLQDHVLQYIHQLFYLLYAFDRCSEVTPCI